jgi:hypothetical protein
MKGLLKLSLTVAMWLAEIYFAIVVLRLLIK